MNRGDQGLGFPTSQKMQLVSTPTTPTLSTGSLSFPAGRSPINFGDLVEIGGPGNEAYSAACIDYAKTSGANNILAQTSLSASGASNARIPMLTDALGNIYIYAASVGLSKYSATGSVIATVLVAGSMPKLFWLANGNLCLVTQVSNIATANIYDQALNVVASNSLTATSSSYIDACALSGGGFAVVTDGNQLLLCSNTAGSIVTATIDTLVSTANGSTPRVAQLPNGNLVCAWANAAANVGSYFNIISTAGANVLPRQSVQTSSGCRNIDIAVPPASSPLGGTFALLDGYNYCGVYAQSGTVKGAVTRLTSGGADATYSASSRLVTDGLAYWVVSQSNGVILQVWYITAAGSGSASSYSLTYSLANLALDACVMNGMLVVIYADTTKTQSVFVMGAPDASLGITAPYLALAKTAIGSAAGTTGMAWPRVVSNGDFTALFAYDQQSTAGIFLAIYKLFASAIVGVSQSTIAAGNNGSATSVAVGTNSYAVNHLGGTSGGVAFNHTSATPVGAAGTLFNGGATITTAA